MAQAGTPPAHARGQHPGPGEHGHNRLYFMIWIWLLVITVLEVGLVLVHVPRVLQVVTLLAMTVLKATLIVANYMHLRWERISLVYVIITPFIFALILWYGMSPDF